MTIKGKEIAFVVWDDIGPPAGYLDDMKVGPDAWVDQYQCRPVPEEIPSGLALCNTCRRVVGDHRRKYGPECRCGGAQPGA